MPPPPPPTVGAHAVVRTTHTDHPACDVASFVAGRPPLHAVRLIVCGGGGGGAPPAPRLPPPPPFYAATVPVTDLLAPSFIEWAAPGDGATASGVTAPASIDGGGAASLDPAGVLTLALPGPDWRRLGLGGTRDAGGADVYTVSVRLRSQRAKRDAERKAKYCPPLAAGEPAPTPAACGGAATAHAALARLAPPPVGVVWLPPPDEGNGGTPPPPPLAGVRTVTPTVATAAVSVSDPVDVPAALGLGGGGAPVDADAARRALEFLGAAAARLTTSHTAGAAPPTTLTIDSVEGLFPPEYAVAAVAAARAAVEALAGDATTTTPAAAWAAVVGVPFTDAPRTLVDGHPPRPCARPDADRAAAWAVVVVRGGGCAFVCASGGGGRGRGDVLSVCMCRTVSLSSTGVAS